MPRILKILSVSVSCLLILSVLCIYSLGMTVLELASDLDLPRGGDGWHILRNGQLPDEFLRGLFALHSFKQSLECRSHHMVVWFMS